MTVSLIASCSTIKTAHPYVLSPFSSSEPLHADIGAPHAVLSLDQSITQCTMQAHVGDWLCFDDLVAYTIYVAGRFEISKVIYTAVEVRRVHNSMAAEGREL